MPIIEKNKKNWKLVGDKIVLEPSFVKIGLSDSKWTKFSKITGSRFNVVLGLSHYKTPFQGWCTMVKIFKEPFIPEELNVAGNKIEVIMKEWYSKKFQNNKEFITQDPMTCGFDVFSNNKIFGGIPDGEPKEGYSSGLPMLEMKTSSIDKLQYRIDKITGGMKLEMAGKLPKVKTPLGKKAEWFPDGGPIAIPFEYKLQLALYMYLRGINNGIFLVSFLKPEDYVNPTAYNPETGDTHVVEFKVNNMNEFKKQYIDVAEAWYNKYIVGGESPQMTAEDKKWWNEQLTRESV